MLELIDPTSIPSSLPMNSHRKILSRSTDTPWHVLVYSQMIQITTPVKSILNQTGGVEWGSNIICTTTLQFNCASNQCALYYIISSIYIGGSDSETGVNDDT